ncbi:MAG: ABC transporter ATP-binding protein [Sedimentisphaerales bacterium]|nr:ABC transporter ATP-binding protein [Sedimentisphaerales bacterium]
MEDVLLKTEKLCKTFRQGRLETPVLFDIDMKIKRGEFVAIMGSSGCGKSTLMHILGLMLKSSSGRVIIDGLDTSALDDNRRARLRRDKIGFVFQRFNLLPTLNAYQNIAVAERIRGHCIDGQIWRALEAVQMTDKKQYKPGQLSIGQQQRIAIARAISHQPEIIMADEPTGNLDSSNSERILNLFSQIHRQQGITIVMITHSLTAAQWADRIIQIKDGRIVDH